MDDGERLAERVLGELASAPPEAGLVAAERVRKGLIGIASRHARAIAARSSWAAVGRLLGVTRQAAHERFGKVAEPKE